MGKLTKAQCRVLRLSIRHEKPPFWSANFTRTESAIAQKLLRRGYYAPMVKTVGKSWVQGWFVSDKARKALGV